jgi:hypothetical protein
MKEIFLKNYKDLLTQGYDLSGWEGERDGTKLTFDILGTRDQIIIQVKRYAGRIEILIPIAHALLNQNRKFCDRLLDQMENVIQNHPDYRLLVLTGAMEIESKYMIFGHIIGDTRTITYENKR